MCVCGFSYLACKAHAPYCNVICGLSGCIIFFPHYPINCTIFGKTLLNKNECFDLPYDFETYLALRRIQWGTIINDHFNHTWILSTDFWKMFVQEVLWKSVQWEPRFFFSWGRTDRHDESTGNFANAPKIASCTRILWTKIINHKLFVNFKGHEPGTDGSVTVTCPGLSVTDDRDALWWQFFQFVVLLVWRLKDNRDPIMVWV